MNHLSLPIDLQLAAFGLLFLSLLTAAAVTDWRTGRLPDRQNLIIFLGGLAFCATPYGPGVLNGVGAAGVGAAALLVVAWTYRRGQHRDGLGGGDIKFVAACGPWIGVFGLAPMIFVAAVGALAFVGASLVLGKSLSRTTEIRFGPFLAAAALLVWCARVSGVAPAFFEISSMV